MVGKTLGHYQISGEPIGKGGMGVVYRARDLKLGRDVAIKVLPEEFARDADRVARFQREAKLLASLNHPNIAAIYGLEESGGIQFLVLELVEGGTLADRVKHGPIDVEESLKLALQIAEALEAAHEKGVIHRDLKPANIKVTPEGRVKVLDFGLAKAFAAEQADLNLSNSPTLSNAATQQGVILGTAAYMSPEQARGKPVDKRADIWAFGCVLFEMLTGRTAFQGEDISEILASVIKGDVKLDLLPANIHPRVREALTRCLQKDLRRRYPDVTDARYEIEQALQDPSGVLVQSPAAAEPHRNWRLMLLWIAFAVVVTAIVAGIAGWKLKAPEPPKVTRLYSELPRDQQFGHLLERAIAVSPDGRQFVYSTSRGLYLRFMDEWDAKFITGSDGAQSPFFSPDGKWIGFVSPEDRKLKKIAISGGAPVPLTDAAGTLGPFSWEADDTIVYSQERGIMRASAAGGTPDVIVKEEKGTVIFPQILPGGESVLFTHSTREAGRRSTVVAVQSLKSAERKLLFRGVFAQYLPTGHILYIGENYNLFAVPFDPHKLQLTGGHFSMTERIYRIGLWPQYAVSNSGTLVYVPEAAVAPVQRALVWVDRNGKEEPTGVQPNAYVHHRISPDGKQVVINIGAGEDVGVWIWDTVRQTLTPLTYNNGVNSAPLWTPNGNRIAYLSFRESIYSLNWKAANGTGTEEALVSSPPSDILPAMPAFWLGDGKTLLLMRINLRGGTPSTDIGALSMEGDRKWKPLLQEKYSEIQPQISPDGRWMAYTSDESGKYQIYVRPFPEVGTNRWQVSTDGGHSPLWSRDGRELFYRNDDAVMAVTVKTGSTFTCEMPGMLFRGTYVSLPATLNWRAVNTWDISRDGKRFLMMKESESATREAGGPLRFNIVLNWFEELKQHVPAK